MTIHLVDIDHVGIAVADLEEAVEHYRASLGVEPVHRERVEDQGVDEVLFPVGSSFIQLLGAIGPKWVPGFSRWAVLHESLEQQFLDQFGLRMLERNELWCFSENLERKTFRKLGALRRFSSVADMMAEAVKTVGKSATVSIFPYGGITYALRVSSQLKASS